MIFIMEFRKAEKRKAKLRLGITGAAGSGEGIKQAESLGYDIIIIDSLSHAWGTGRSSRTTGAGAATVTQHGAQVTPQHNKLNSPCHT